METWQWIHRGACGACASVLWSDRPGKVMCLCSKSWVETDGTFGGLARETSDEEMKDYILADSGVVVALERLE